MNIFFVDNQGSRPPQDPRQPRSLFDYNLVDVYYREILPHQLISHPNTEKAAL
jgi:hypothetical protein